MKEIMCAVCLPPMDPHLENHRAQTQSKQQTFLLSLPCSGFFDQQPCHFLRPDMDHAFKRQRMPAVSGEEIKVSQSIALSGR